MVWRGEQWGEQLGELLAAVVLVGAGAGEDGLPDQEALSLVLVPLFSSVCLAAEPLLLLAAVQMAAAAVELVEGVQKIVCWSDRRLFAPLMEVAHQPPCI